MLSPKNHKTTLKDNLPGEKVTAVAQLGNGKTFIEKEKSRFIG
jgi:hypothetical protein